jgi:hypothetical protein
LNDTGVSFAVLVRDNNIDQALRVLKKKMQREGVFREMNRGGIARRAASPADKAHLLKLA